jgi:hypothetical protein
MTGTWWAHNRREAGRLDRFKLAVCRRGGVDAGRREWHVHMVLLNHARGAPGFSEVAGRVPIGADRAPPPLDVSAVISRVVRPIFAGVPFARRFTAAARGAGSTGEPLDRSLGRSARLVKPYARSFAADAHDCIMVRI